MRHSQIRRKGIESNSPAHLQEPGSEALGSALLKTFKSSLLPGFKHVFPQVLGLQTLVGRAGDIVVVLVTAETETSLHAATVV